MTDQDQRRDLSKPRTVPVAVCVVGDPSEGEGELYGQWRKP